MPCSRILLRVCGCWLIWVLVLGCSDLVQDPGNGSVYATEAPMNLVVIVLDAARADHFGSYGYARNTTPNADAFAADATRYAHVRAEAPYTFLSTSTLFMGASPDITGLGARTGGRVPESMELLSEQARDAGFRTFGYSENPYVTRYFGLAQGFDVFEEAYPTEALEAGRELSPDIDSAGRLAAMIDRASQGEAPFLFYAHLLRPHNPYLPPPPHAGLFGSGASDRGLGSTSSLVTLNRRGPPYTADVIERIVALYDENLSFGDALFGGVLDALAAVGIADRTVVVLTADHGEGFAETGALLHSTRLDDAMLRVPLVVRVPGESPGVESIPIQLEDLGRGLRRFVAGDSPATLTRLGAGRDSGRPLVSWTNARTGWIAAWTPERRVVIDARTQKFIRVEDAMGAEYPPDDEARALRRLLVSRVADWVGTTPASAEPPLDATRLKQLEALGYIVP